MRNQRVLCILMASAIVVCGLLVRPAHALDVSAKGEFQFTFGYTKSPDLYWNGWDGQSEDGFYASQRIRIEVDIAATEMLNGVYYAEIGSLQWGNPADGAVLGADGVNVRTKRAYLDISIPDTDLMFRVGVQGIAIPCYITTSPILDDDMAGIAAVWQITESFGIAAAWARLYDLDPNTVSTKNSPDADEFDLWGLRLGFTGNGWEAQPWIMAASIGRDVFPRQRLAGLLSPVHALALQELGAPLNAVNYPLTGVDPYPTRSASAQLNYMASMTGDPTLSAYAAGYAAQLAATSSPTYYYDGLLRNNAYIPALWFGVGGKIGAFDPITIFFDSAWGSVMAKESSLDRSGWYAAAKLDYKLENMTLGVLGFYGSGENGDWSDGSEQLPIISSDGFGITSFGFGGSLLNNADTVYSDNPAGKWGIGFSIEDLTFIADLTHQFRVLYMRGTNAPESRRLIGLPQSNFGLTGIAGFQTPTNTLNVWGVKGYGAIGAPATNAALRVQNLAFAQAYSALSFPATYNTGLNTGPYGVQMTTEDSYWEVNFDHKYAIYENLAAILELGMFHVDYGNDTWVHDDTSTAWKAVFGLVYKF